VISRRRNKSDSLKRSARKIDSKRVKQTRAHAGAADGQILARLAPSQTANGGFTLSADHCILRDPPWSESSCCRVASRGSGLQKHLDQAEQVADLALLQDDDDDDDRRRFSS